MAEPTRILFISAIPEGHQFLSKINIEFNSIRDGIFEELTQHNKITKPTFISTLTKISLEKLLNGSLISFILAVTEQAMAYYFKKKTDLLQNS